MTSRTGSRTKKAFTLVEVMVSTAVLALGIVLVYQALFVCLDAFSYYSNYVDVSVWMDEKLWEAQDALNRTGTLGLMDTSGEQTVQNRQYVWDIVSQGKDPAVGLYQAVLTVSWRSGKKQRQLTRTAFAIYEKE